MNIGIVGTGHIGATLVKKLSAAGHSVKVANSRGPETIEADLLQDGAQPVTATEVFEDVDVVILSIPMKVLPEYRELAMGLNDSVVLIDTSNHYPMRDGKLLEDSKDIEAEWVQESLGRPIVKAFNAIGAPALAGDGRPDWATGLIAIPITGDREEDKATTISLINDIGFDAYDAGAITESWRIQPGNPAYCTDLTLDELPQALANANAERAPKLRDIFVEAAYERMTDAAETNPPADWGVQLSRILYAPK
ncbi:NAD(P)-binding domain-containing protein [Rothia sp. LK2588]|uniref:NADPH-dependent F420 reductase n=1 Tax=Rothia sp. LK2588 TaxID=3114369 RepID=UPI0034CEEB7B